MRVKMGPKRARDCNLLSYCVNIKSTLKGLRTFHCRLVV